MTLCFCILILTFNATSVSLIKGQQVNVSQCSETNTADPWAKWVWTAQVLLKVGFSVLTYYSSTQLVESADAESQIQKSNKKVILGYLHRRSAHALFKSVVDRAQDWGQTNQDSEPNSHVVTFSQSLYLFELWFLPL